MHRGKSSVFKQITFDNLSKSSESFEKVKLFIIFLVILSFSLLSCPRTDENEEDNRRFRGGRTKIDHSTKRNTNKIRLATAGEQSQQGSSDGSELDFPIIINPANHSDLSITSSDNKKLSIAVEPSEEPMTVVAGWSGQLSLSTENGVHTLTLSSPTNSKIIYLELTEENTDLRVSDGSNVNQRQVLAQTTSPLTFYVKEGEELALICFPIEELEKKINVKKKFADHRDCL